MNINLTTETLEYFEPRLQRLYDKEFAAGHLAKPVHILEITHIVFYGHVGYGRKYRIEYWYHESGSKNDYKNKLIIVDVGGGFELSDGEVL